MLRFVDIFFSGLAIIILLPFLLPIIIFLKLTGEHDIFYRQTRIGFGGREFGLLKFATMLRDSPNLPGGLFTEKNDPRMLPLGNFLRKSKINELPQLINILVGDMSIVGYRPTVPKHFAAYPDDAKTILSESKPGLTGIGSIVFRNEEEILQAVPDKGSFHRDIINPYKASLECWYVTHAGFRNYLKVILITAWVILAPENQAWRRWFRGLPPVPADLQPHIGVLN